jgi:hypothetical protein
MADELRIALAEVLPKAIGLPSTADTGHIAAVGPTRLGQGLHLTDTLIRSPGPVVCIDPKGEQWQRTAGFRQQAYGPRLPHPAARPRPRRAVRPGPGLGRPRAARNATETVAGWQRPYLRRQSPAAVHRRREVWQQVSTRSPSSDGGFRTRQ